MVLDLIPGAIALVAGLAWLQGTPWWISQTSDRWLDCFSQHDDSMIHCGPASEFNAGGAVALIILLLGSWMLYSVVLTAGLRGTPGQLIVGIRVGTPDGKAASIRRACLRWLAFAAPWLLIAVGYVVVFASMSCQTTDTGRYLCTSQLSPAYFLTQSVPFVGVLGLACNLLVIASDRAHRGLHDRLAGTVVFVVDGSAG